MKTRKTKFITRYYCPETNSSSSHSLIVSREKFKESDLLEKTQTLFYELNPDGEKIITIDGSVVNDLDSMIRKSNDSRVKAAYLAASIKCLFPRKPGPLIDIVKEVIKDTLKVDEVKFKNISAGMIDHQSRSLLADVVRSKDYDIFQDFIFNPRIWLFFFWDCEDSPDNQCLSVCEDYFNYEISIELPVIVELFEQAPRIDKIDLVYRCVELPDADDLSNFAKYNLTRSFINHYDKKIGGFVQDDDIDRVYTIEESEENHYVFIGFSSEKTEIKAVFLKKGVIPEVSGKLLTRVNRLNFTEKDRKKFKIDPRIDNWTKDYLANSLPNKDPYEFIIEILSSYIHFMDTEFMESIGITEDNSISFEVKLYSRKENYVL